MKREPIEGKLPDVSIKTPMPEVKQPKTRVEFERDDYYKNLKIADKEVSTIERKLKITEDAYEWMISSILYVLEYHRGVAKKYGDTGEVHTLDSVLQIIKSKHSEALSKLKEE